MQPQETQSNSIKHSAKSTAIKVDYRKLVNLHLLGKVEDNAKQTPKKQEIIKAPETNLNLKLIGVLFNRQDKDGYAIISESGKSHKTFHKGDKLPGNATLYAVESNRVILERNGRHETLSLLKPDSNTKGPTNGNEQPPGAPIQAWRSSRTINGKQPLPDVLPRAFSKTERKF